MGIPPRLLSCALALALAWPAPVPAQGAVPGRAPLPTLGDAASADLPVAAERELGLRIMDEIRRDPQYLDDPVLLAYVQSVWQPLLAAARRLGHIGPDVDTAFAWQPFLIRDPSLNAFALPAGFVGIHLGLIARTDNSAQLASVLAHELSHVTQRHIARQVGAMQRQSLVGLAAMLLAMVAAARSENPAAIEAAMVTPQAVLMQGQLNFSRGVEREADRTGYEVLVAAGYPGSGMATMFEKLDRATRLNDRGDFAWLRSHPLTVERIAEARSHAVSEPVPPDPLHALMAARAAVLGDLSATALGRWAAAPGDDDAPTVYARALARTLLGDRAAALRDADILASRFGSNAATHAAIALLEAEVQAGAGAPQQALAALAALAELAPTRPAAMLRARAAVALWDQGGAEREATLRASAEQLQGWTALHPDDTLAWDLLAQSASRLGWRLRALRAEAEVRATSGDLQGAIDRLRAAQHGAEPAQAGDLIELQVIDARLAAVQAALRERRKADAERNG